MRTRQRSLGRAPASPGRRDRGRRVPIAEFVASRSDRTARADVASRFTSKGAPVALLLGALLAAFAGDAVAAGVRTVGTAPGDQPSIAVALSTAVDGDVVLVRSGTYGAFTVDGKGVSVVADLGASVVVFGGVRVKNLAPGQLVLLSGLTVAAPGVDALVAQDNQGTLRVESTALQAYATSTFSLVSGAVLTNCVDVAFEHVSAQGGTAMQSFATAGDGVRATNSRLALVDCQIVGSAGANGDSGSPAPGTSGGAGLRAFSGEIYATGCTFVGGAGGRGGVQSTGSGCAAQVPLAGGDGGTGLAAEGSPLATSVRVRDVALHGGLGGTGGVTNCGVAAASGSSAPTNTGVLQLLTQPFRGVNASTVAREGTSATFTCTGVPGDRVVLFVSTGPGWSWHAGLLAPVLIRNPFERRVALGVVPPSGTLVSTLTIPELGPGVPVSLRHVQAWFADTNGVAHLGGGGVLTLLDGAY